MLVRNPGRLPADLKAPAVDVVVGDLSRGTDLAGALEGIRCVYHLARPHVKSWNEWVEHEVESTRRVGEACLAAKVGRLIYTGTIDSYYAGARAGTITEETPLDPQISGGIITLERRPCRNSRSRSSIASGVCRSSCFVLAS